MSTCCFIFIFTQSIENAKKNKMPGAQAAPRMAAEAPQTGPYAAPAVKRPGLTRPPPSTGPSSTGSSLYAPKKPAAMGKFVSPFKKDDDQQ